MQSRVVTIVVLYIFPEAAAEVECLPLAAMLTAIAVAAVMTRTNAAVGAACRIARRFTQNITARPQTQYHP